MESGALAEIVLDVALSNKRMPIEEKMMLGVQWDKEMIIERVLETQPLYTEMLESNLTDAADPHRTTTLTRVYHNLDLLLYAAARDQGEVVRHMLDHGVDITRLNVLVFHEICIAQNEKRSKPLDWKDVNIFDKSHGWLPWQLNTQSLKATKKALLRMENLRSNPQRNCNKEKLEKEIEQLKNKIESHERRPTEEDTEKHRSRLGDVSDGICKYYFQPSHLGDLGALSCSLPLSLSLSLSSL
jgi:hypothetical protein